MKKGIPHVHVPLVRLKDERYGEPKGQLGLLVEDYPDHATVSWMGKDSPGGLTSHVEHGDLEPLGYLSIEVWPNYRQTLINCEVAITGYARVLGAHPLTNFHTVALGLQEIATALRRELSDEMGS